MEDVYSQHKVRPHTVKADSSDEVKVSTRIIIPNGFILHFAPQLLPASNSGMHHLHCLKAISFMSLLLRVE
jgi:hypothetical protein